ncbi:MAG: hydrogenase iron-sulfur subunit [Desulfobaccales bacterium]
MSTEAVIFACQQAVPDPEALLVSLGKAGNRWRVLSEPCSSKMEAFQLLRALGTPADLVWVIGCDKTLCRYQDGSRRLGGRVQYSQGYLEEIGLESGRLGYSLVTPGDAAALAGVVKEVKARLQALGPSPLKAKV